MLWWKGHDIAAFSRIIRLQKQIDEYDANFLQVKK